MADGYDVPSFTDEATVYRVTWGGYDWACTCPAWRPSRPRCKHVRIVVAAVARISTCARTHAGRVADACGQCLVDALRAAAVAVARNYVKKEDANARVARAKARKKQRRKPAVRR